MSSSHSTGVLLIAHGTRSAAGVEQFLALARSLAQRLAPLPVEPAFLELAKPDIDAAVDGLLARGIDRLVMMPLLLFAAGHIKRDIPRAVAAALTRRGMQHIQQIQADHLGCHPAIVELSRRRMEDAMPPERHSSTCLLIVARGSRDDSATAEMYDFARLRQQNEQLVPRLFPGNALTGSSRLRVPRDDGGSAAQRGRASRSSGPRVDPGTEIMPAGIAHPTIHVEVAFLAMARPLLNEKLAEVAAKGYVRVIVQPHFLFEGELVESIGTQVAAIASIHPETNWRITPPLADRAGCVTPGAPLIEKVIFDRLFAAGIHVVAPAGDD